MGLIPSFMYIQCMVPCRASERTCPRGEEGKRKVRSGRGKGVREGRRERT